jgi:hypothetical protein
MKKKHLLMLAGMISFSVYSQIITSDFEDLNLAVDTFWNGSDASGQFTSNTVIFKNIYDTAWGGSWSGVSYSSMKNDSTAGFMNQFSCISGEGYNSSQSYSVFYTRSSDSLVSIPNNGRVNGFWINNSTYAYLSMKNGDAFSKKFGDSTNSSGMLDGTNGNDFFKLTIFGTNSDSVEFYLADFRGAASADYIIKDWTYVDLSSLNPNSKQLSFVLTSSDIGSFGMNTPQYFCMDNFEYLSVLSSINDAIESSISIYPNPTQNRIKINFGVVISNATYKLIDIAGRELKNISVDGVSSLELDLTNEKKGLYFLMITNGNESITKRIIRN